MNDYRVSFRLRGRARVVVRVRAESVRGAQRIAMRYASLVFGERWRREYPLVERARA